MLGDAETVDALTELRRTSNRLPEDAKQTRARETILFFHGARFALIIRFRYDEKKCSDVARISHRGSRTTCANALDRGEGRPRRGPAMGARERLHVGCRNDNRSGARRVKNIFRRFFPLSRSAARRRPLRLTRRRSGKTFPCAREMFSVSHPRTSRTSLVFVEEPPTTRTRPRVPRDPLSR